jgi:hypothetical protein
MCISPIRRLRGDSADEAIGVSIGAGEKWVKVYHQETEQLLEICRAARWIVAGK